MSKRDQRLFLQDIFESIEKIEDYTSNIGFEEFLSNGMVKDAVIRNFEIIGEASIHISGKLKSKYASIPWNKIKSMRNFVAHEYFGINYDVIWETIKKSLPDLKAKISKVIAQESDE